MSYLKLMQDAADDPNLSLGTVASCMMRALVKRLASDPKSATPAELAAVNASLADLIRANNEAGNLLI